MLRQYELVERVRGYDPGADEDVLNRAYVFCMKAHGTQTRASGDPYFSHPVEVAGLLSEKRLDYASIVTGLLHDTVEDTAATVEEIQRLFGGEVASLVDGVTKLSQLELQSDRTKQAENFRKLLLAMSQDIRVLIVKLADRLHNMRTLHFIKAAAKRRRIALETMDIYVPLAERIGIRDWKEELEDLAFKELNTDAREAIVSRLESFKAQGVNPIPGIIQALKKLLADNGIENDVSGREKTPYSIWRKMQRQNVGFEQLADIMAFRVIVNSVEQCYHALGVIHATYRVVPGRFKDYISLPKPNGYASLHTGVYGPGGQRIEVQIRTRSMHEVAELGVAAHWQYKQGSVGPASSTSTEGKQFRWLRELLEILEHASSPDDFLENTKMEMYSDQVFAFTPKGDLHALPRGATPVDFAYAVHSQIGNTCLASKINGRIMPLRTPLQNGDQVEIITSKAQTPSPTWESFVVTGKARAAIRRFVRAKQREQYSTLGRAILEKAFAQDKYDLTEKALKGVLKKFRKDTLDDLYAAVGDGQVAAREVLYAVYPGAKRAVAEAQARSKTDPEIIKAKPAGESERLAVPIRGLINGMAVHYAGCCHPLPGDRIVGIISTGKGVTIHTIDCDTLENFADAPERWLDVKWEDGAGAGKTFVGRITITMTNEPNSLATVTSVIGRDKGNITNLKITHRDQDFFGMLLDIEVSDVKQLIDIIAALRAQRVVQQVDRARG